MQCIAVISKIHLGHLTRQIASSFFVSQCRSQSIATRQQVNFCRVFSFSANLNNTKTMEYPPVRRDESFVEELHGVKVPDPYRWLEDVDSEETKAFVEAQNALTEPFLEKCSAQAIIKEKLTAMNNHPKYSCPYKRGKRYFYYMNRGLENQSILYMQDSLDGEAREYLNPNKLSEDGTVSIAGSRFSEDGEVHAYMLSKSGSDWTTVHFKKVATGEDYPEVLEKVKFSGLAWTHDNKGIFYGCYRDQEGKTDGSETTSNENQKLFYHRLGTPQEEDILVVDFPDHPKWRIGASVSDCGKYLVITPVQDCKDNLLYFAALPDEITGRIELTPVVDKLEAEYEYVSNDGSVCVVRTNKDALNYHLIKIDLLDPARDKWSVLLPENKKDVLDWVQPIHNDKMLCCYIQDVKSVLQLRSLVTGELLCQLPLDIGTVNGVSGERKQSELFYKFTSKLSPGIIYHLELNVQPYVPKVFREIKVEGVDPSKYEMQQVFYNSKDGTRVPMFLMHRKDVSKDGSNPVLMYGYGGFNISLQPTFSYGQVLFMQLFGGVVAVPNLRGGGEYGDAWHNGGRLLNKQNVFDDFHAAAEYLIKEGYTKPELLTSQGGSNGGLLVAACANQRPDLYGAVIAQVGVMDLLRFHKFTIGYAWCSDYGNPDEEKHFRNLYKLSPYHNVKAPQTGQFPAMLLLTADHDDRVVPPHSFKFISELQHKLHDQKNPLLIRIDTKAGHGGGKPTMKVIEESTDIFCFVMNCLNLKLID
ncbi:Peptidase S9 prolyl oligopeptidase catalytic domain [Trinorchestia longiramus]|nr:Peptidase S9 prolyl oligopeptidase catalytic domain [Trinorchestia longiramus]